VYPAHFIIPAWLDNRWGRRLLPDLPALPGRVSPDEVTARLTQRLEEGAETGTPFFVHGVYSRPTAAAHREATPGAAEPPASGEPDGGFDEQLGRVLASLDKNGLRDKTILVVLGRPNPALPVTPADGPETPAMTDAPLPVVLYVPGDSFAPGVVSQLTRLLDLAPTLLEVLGLPGESSMEGISLKPLLETPRLRLPLAAFGESAGFPEAPPAPTDPESVKAAFRDGVRLDPASGHRLVLRDEAAARQRKSRWLRTESWQLVFTPAAASPEGVDEWRLFDLRSDPASTRDVKLQNPKVWQTMEVALRHWADEKKETRITDIFPDGEPPAALLPGT